MRNFLFLIITTALIISCKNNNNSVNIPAADNFLVTDSAWGPITAATDFENLKKLFGETNVKDELICGPECINSILVTKLYPGQKNETIIYWNDTAFHKKISLIECFRDSADWHTADGIKIGSPFADLLKVNGSKISFSGFGWDYGGHISSFNGGRLSNTRIGYRLTLMDDPQTNDVYGDTTLHTDTPAIKKNMNIISVYWLTLSFYEPAEEETP